MVETLPIPADAVDGKHLPKRLIHGVGGWRPSKK